LDTESVRAYCLSFPQATENVQWGNDLCFKIAGKIFAVMALEGPVKYMMSFKCTEEKFNELIEQEGIDPAPYMARNKWVAIERFDVLSDKELKALLRNSYDMVVEKLPKKVREQLGASSPPTATTRPKNSPGRKRH
jgi:predicted DNA-binding protein (MmcQ/YjbR family)